MRAGALLFLVVGCGSAESPTASVPSASAAQPAPAASASTPEPARSAAAPDFDPQALAACCAALEARLRSTPPDDLDAVARVLLACRKSKTDGSRAALRAALPSMPGSVPNACR